MSLVMGMVGGMSMDLSDQDAVRAAGAQLADRFDPATAGAEDLARLYHAAVGLAEALVAEAQRDHPPAAPPACSPGCFYCCILKVDATVPEVLHLARWLHDNRTAEELDTLIGRLAEIAPRVQGKGDQARADLQILCPLLDGLGSCSVHPARPLICRSYSARNKEQCILNYNNPDDWRDVSLDPHEHQLTGWVDYGLEDGLKEKGLVVESVELIGALHIALTNPQAAADWLAGGEPFYAARAVTDPED